ncbi:MAG TPA: phycobilisome rod-core linker polypeptide [Rhizomicrobium sp.]|nr:phycobilisome rod-core linker polypeptide [Rhizomicrobium sp.]
MATQHTDDRAESLAHDLYSRFLNRNPDADGHKYVAESLREGRKSVRQHVLEIVGSEEFRKKFVRNRSRENVVQHLHMVLLGKRVTDPYRLARQAADFTILDLVPYAERLTRSDDYKRRYGEDELPGVREAADS